VRDSSGRFGIVAGAMLAGVAVAAGAFGAHGLKEMLSATGQVDNWETASRYALVHALGLILTGLVARLPGSKAGLAAAAAGCLLVGTLIFSGFLATLAVTGLRILGAIVPIGGVLMIAGWVLLAAAAAGITPRST
jgi:uncharacterized membrane protein YgdD (TMEM256/DUF423 family)